MCADSTEPDVDPSAAEQDQPGNRYPELDELQQEVAKRLRDNQKFLDHFLDEDFAEETDEESEPPAEDFEEL